MRPSGLEKSEWRSASLPWHYFTASCMFLIVLTEVCIPLHRPFPNWKVEMCASTEHCLRFCVLGLMSAFFHTNFLHGGLLCRYAQVLHKQRATYMVWSHMRRRGFEASTWVCCTTSYGNFVRIQEGNKGKK